MSGVRIVAAVLAVGMTVATAWLSRAPMAFTPEAPALLRLSWRVDGVSVEACRTLSQDELAALPVHMRNPEACIGTIAPFELHATLDGRQVVMDTLDPGGARGDRPIYVLRDVPIVPGSREVSVRFRALVADGADVGDVATDYAWDGTIEVRAGEIALITLDEGGGLVLRTPGVGPPGAG